MTTTRYYPDGKLWKVIDAKGNNSVVNTYNKDGSLKQVQDANKNEGQPPIFLLTRAGARR